ncbi:MAG: ABC transporter substrate-binding protein [Gammaproteobacteria bacterium]|nr:ABC transporter substrate-binding protein [Gammaproteobacteria bacterium]
MKKLVAFVLLLISSLTFVPNTVFAKDHFKVCWSIYVGWMPWDYAAKSGIVKKWADKYGISIDVVQINDYVESINQYTAGGFDACTMTNMDALTIPAAGNVDSTALIIGDFSNGNDGVVLKNKKDFKEIKGQKVNLVQLSVSHYLLARGLESIGLSEKDITVVNTSDADIVSVYGTKDVNAVVTWNPLLSTILAMPASHEVFDSSKIPGEIIDLMVVNTKTLQENPKLGKALTGAWYEIMALMNSKSEPGKKARSDMAAASATDLKGFEAQLATTKMFYTPAEAVAFNTGAQLKKTMQYVAEFSFTHGLLGTSATDAKYIGIETPAGGYGNSANVKLRFDPTYMKLAAEGKL